MINQKQRLLNTLNHKLLFCAFVFCLAVVAGTIGCSDSGGKAKTGYYLSGYDGVVDGQVSAQQSLVSAVGNTNLRFYSEFPWFVNMTYQVFDKNQWGVGDLQVEDFTVFEDGVEVSQLVSEMNTRQRNALPSEYSYTIKTVMFLDNTPSLSVGLDKMLEAGQVVVDNIDELQQQEIAIVAYDESGEAELVQDFTKSVSDLTEALSPVDGIQRNRRDPPANTSIDGSRIRVSAALCNVTEDLHPLMRDLDAGTPADLLEVHHPTGTLGAVSLQRRTPRSEWITI